MIVDLKFILALNMFGLAASFIARRFFKGKPFSEFVPYGFLYISAILCLQSVMNPGKPENTEQATSFDSVNQILEYKEKLGSLQIENDSICHELSFSQKAVYIKSILKKFAMAESFGDSNVFLSVVDESQKAVEWDTFEYNNLSNKDLALSVRGSVNEYLDTVSLIVTNKSEVARKVKLVLNIKLDKLNSASFDKSKQPKKLVAITSNHWLNIIGFDFDSIEQSQQHQDYIQATKEINIAAGQNASVDLKVLTAPNQISKIQNYEQFFGPGLEDVVYEGNILTRFVSSILYKPLVFAFEWFTTILLNPLFAFIAILLIFKLLTAPLNYQGHGFSQEFQKIISMAAATKNQDGVRDAIMNNKNLDIKNKIISVVLKLTFFFVFWRVINNSPLFYGKSLLWIKNLAVQDSLGLNNLFGFSGVIPYLPYIGLSPLITMILLFFEIQEKNKGMENKQNQSTLLIMLAFFLYGINNMPAIFCVYLVFNNVFDSIQSYIFQMIKKQPKPRARTIKNG